MKRRVVSKLQQSNMKRKKVFVWFRSNDDKK